LTVDFQGVEIELSQIGKSDDVNQLNALDYYLSSLLLKNGKHSINISTVDTVKYYIDRTLQLRKKANTRLPPHGQMQPKSRVDILQETRDSSLHLEKI
jgi:hypothetical protein